MGASFFISRDLAERKNSRRIFHSLIYQLCVRNPRFSVAVVNALRNKRDITGRPLSEQIPLLLTKPLKIVASATQPILMVLDALDECDIENGQEGGSLLLLLAQAVLQFRETVKLSITSREEHSTCKMFREVRDKCGERDTIQLHSLDQAVTQSDIRLYLKAQLYVIAERWRIPNGSWPSEDVLLELSRRAGMLFVYAGTIVRFLGNRNWDPTERLQVLLGTSTTESETHEPYKMVGNLYMNVLAKALEDEEMNKEPLYRRLRAIVGTIVLLQDPLEFHALAVLLNITTSNIFAVVHKLTAVVIVPDRDNRNDPIRIFHPSFADSALLRYQDDRMRIDAGFQYRHIVQ
jgi:hypothetical protein